MKSAKQRKKCGESGQKKQKLKEMRRKKAWVFINMCLVYVEKCQKFLKSGQK